MARRANSTGRAGRRARSAARRVSSASGEARCSRKRLACAGNLLGGRTSLSIQHAGLPLVDHHCHGVLAAELDAGGFELLINEGGLPPSAGTTHWQSPLGLAIRRRCAPVLGLEAGAAADAYMAERRALGVAEVNRRFLRATGLEGLLLDTGHRAGELLSAAAMGELAGAMAYEVVRLEAVAEQVAATGVAARAYGRTFRDALERAARGAAGLKTIVAYRGGFAFEPSPPSDRDVAEAAGRWFRAMAGGMPRLSDQTLIRFGIWAGAELARQHGMPLQVHCGFGDPDLTLHQANPVLLTDLIRRFGDVGVPVALLHCYPYHREAGYLATVFPHVVFDVGLAIPHTGAGGRRVLAEALEVAPFTKLLYSSDAFGLAELHYLGATLFREALGGLLDEWIRDGACSADDAEAIAGLLAGGNARRVYRLGAR
jgi:predicted TIM-barrel fold metal-dependent hydrolase